MSTILKEVRNIENCGSLNSESRQGMADFMALPKRIYQGNPYWVAPLSFDETKVFSAKNPFWEHANVVCYVAYDENIPVGRIAAIYDYRFNQFHGNGRVNEPELKGSTGFFGFYESENSAELSNKLFAKAEMTLKSWGAERMLGPMDPSLNRKGGLLVRGNEVNHGLNAFQGVPKIMMPYNPDYYQKLLEGDGFLKAKDLLAFKIVSADIVKHTERMAKLAERLTREKTQDGNPKIRVRNLRGLLNPRTWTEDVAILRDLYNTSWLDNWGFTPLTDRESKEFGLDIAIFGGNNLTYIAEVYDEGRKRFQHAGFMGILPDYNLAFKEHEGKITPGSVIKFLKIRRKPEHIRILLLGIKPEFRGRGLDALLYNQIFKAGKKFGIIDGEQSWILEDNLPMMNPLIKSLGAKHYRTYRLYQKPISR